MASNVNLKPRFLSDIISFLELINTTARIDKFLLAGKEGMTLIANVHLERFYFFGSTRFEGRAACAHYRYLVIFGMYIGLHSIHLAVFLNKC